MRYVTTALQDSLAAQKMGFVSGPRQVGKTTLARSLLTDPRQDYFTWDLDRDRRRILRADGPFWASPRRGWRRWPGCTTSSSFVPSPARFENLVALHLTELVDAWNDRGYGDFALWYVRDKERREVDFLVTDRRRPYLLLETKLSDDRRSPALRYFRDRLRPRHAIQLVREGAVRTVDGMLVAPAALVLARMCQRGRG